MNKNSQKRYEYFHEIESLYLSFKKNEDDFIKSWEKFKKNPKKSIITNHTDAQFYADCEKFTKLIIKTRVANEKLDKKFDELVLHKEKSEKRGNEKWDARSAKSHTRILVDFTHGKNNKHADYVAISVTISRGMATICTNIGRKEIEMS